MFILTEMIERIKELKKKEKITNKQLSQATGIPKSTIDKILTGVIKDPAITSIAKIASALCVTPDYLISGDTNPVNYAFSNDVQQLLDSYVKLNTIGREKVQDYTKDLTENEKYTTPDAEFKSKLNA